MTRLDVNKDGYISHEDYNLMGKKMAEHSGMTKEQAEKNKKEFLKVADKINLKPGVKLPLEDAVKKANESLLSMSPTERKTLVNDNHDMLFDAIDTNKDGHISVKEFKVYLPLLFQKLRLPIPSIILMRIYIILLL